MLPPDGGPEFNRLVHENSPYLRQHARNPVDWYPWGAEAFDRARREDKPVFLSVGYSTCHWCHVMERESFEREDVAGILNAHFVAIKVDREQRPDIDAIYMTVTQLATGRGGWPNSVWLTPDRRPWYAGTYFPREDSGGRPGFKTVLTQLADAWKQRRQTVTDQADRITEAVRRAGATRDFTPTGALTRDVVSGALRDLAGAFDRAHGGFGGAPKFPPHGALRVLAYACGRAEDAERLAMLTHTLDAMAAGGIHDHVGGGFHRYATDGRWFLPHFEKMLYDNAQLARAYVDGYVLTGDKAYRQVAARTLDWVLREMTDARGGFHSAIDADSEGEEGKFYVWRPEEVSGVLGDEAGARFCRVYQIAPGGNFRDEATGHQPGTSIPYLALPPADAARGESAIAADRFGPLDADRRRLLDHRARRVWPHIDDKVLAGWNGLMIGSLAYAGRVLEEARYTRAAERAADFIWTTMRRDGRLLRSYRDGQARLNAYLDDYAFLADGLIELYDTTHDRRRLDQARSLMDVLLAHYWDADGAGFFFVSDDHEALLTRTKDPFDGAIPSGNGVAVWVLIRLAQRTGEATYHAKAHATLTALRGFMQQAPHGTLSLVLGAAWWLDSPAGVPATAPTTTAPSQAQPQASSTLGPVGVQAFASRLEVAAGQTVEVVVRVTVEAGWHVNANAPLADDLVPTRVDLAAHAGATLGRIAYPPGRSVRFAFSPDALSVYDGTVSIRVPIRISPDVQPGPLPVVVRVHTQPCDDRRCARPQTHTLTLPLVVTRARATSGP